MSPKRSCCVRRSKVGKTLFVRVLIAEVEWAFEEAEFGSATQTSRSTAPVRSSQNIDMRNLGAAKKMPLRIALIFCIHAEIAREQSGQIL
jgi:hypothetical protein